MNTWASSRAGPRSGAQSSRWAGSPAPPAPRSPAPAAQSRSAATLTGRQGPLSPILGRQSKASRDRMASQGASQEAGAAGAERRRTLPPLRMPNTAVERAGGGLGPPAPEKSPPAESLIFRALLDTGSPAMNSKGCGSGGKAGEVARFRARLGGVERGQRHSFRRSSRERASQRCSCCPHCPEPCSPAPLWSAPPPCWTLPLR